MVCSQLFGYATLRVVIVPGSRAGKNLVALRLTLTYAEGTYLCITGSVVANIKMPSSEADGLDYGG